MNDKHITILLMWLIWSTTMATLAHAWGAEGATALAFLGMVSVAVVGVASSFLAAADKPASPPIKHPDAEGQPDSNGDMV